MEPGHLRPILSRNIRAFADQRGVGINQLADLAGVGRSSLGYVLSERQSPTVDWLERIADVLEVSVMELLDPDANSK